MTKTEKMTGRAMSIPGGILVAALTGTGMTLLLSVTGAVLISKEVISQEDIGVWSMITLLIASSIGAATAATKIKRRRMQMSMLQGLVYYAVLITVALVFFGGQLQGMGTTMVVVMIGSLCGGLIANKGTGRGREMKRRKFRR